MRLGTWNLAGRWSDDHREFVEGLQCDVLLLTEVSDRVELPGMTGHVTEGADGTKAPLGGHLVETPADTARRSARSVRDGRGPGAALLLLDPALESPAGRASPGSGRTPPSGPSTRSTRSRQPRPTVWGGDWNHALEGREYAGSKAGREHLLKSLAELGLSAATTDAPHQIEGLLSIDHIAIPTGWSARVEHHSALLAEGRLSDHDAYVVEADRP